MNRRSALRRPKVADAPGSPGDSWQTQAYPPPPEQDSSFYKQESMEVQVPLPEQNQLLQAGEERAEKKKPWEKIGPDGKVVKRKPNLARRNAVFRKALQPKTAIVCLNELQPGIKFEVDSMVPVGNFIATVEVNGQTFRGCGTSKSIAKQRAAEAALVSYVKPPPPKPEAGQNPTDIHDETPWKTIASFAMYKLFAEWSEGKVGGLPPTQAGFDAAGHDLRAVINSRFETDQAMLPVAANVGMHLHKAPSNNTDVTMEAPQGEKKAATPVKKGTKKGVTWKHATQHPVMALHELVPDIKYESNEEIEAGTNAKKYTLHAIIQEQQFVGDGPSLKKAKFVLAKAALLQLFGVENTYE